MQLFESFVTRHPVVPKRKASFLHLSDSTRRSSAGLLVAQVGRQLASRTIAKVSSSQ